MARENDGSGGTWQLETEVGRTERDVLPHKSASVWCTAINLNDLSPPRACFGIQKPQRGLLACQGCSSFGLLSSVEWLLSLEPVAEGETVCSTPITCPCPQGLTLSRSLRANTPTHWSKDKKPHQECLTANYRAPQPLRAHICIFILLCTALPGADSRACCASEKTTPSVSSHVELVWPLQGVISQGKMNKIKVLVILLFA